MPKPSIPPGKTYPAELPEIFERGNRGDLTVLPDLQQAFAEYPELAAALGDMVAHAEQSFLSMAMSQSLTSKEAISCQVADLRKRLAATTTSELEKLLVDRIAISFLWVYHADVDLANHLQRQPGAPCTQAAQKRLDRAHQRYLTSIKTLAMVQKLVRPCLSPVDMLSRAVPETATGTRFKGRQKDSVTDGAPVLN
jgi:hypothetical protein